MEKEKKPQDKDTKEKNLLDDTLKQAGKRFGKGSIMRPGDRVPVETDTISSGPIKVDEALGIGRYPKGRTVGIYGPKSNGKTTLALHAIAEVQKKGGRVAFIDAENITDPICAKNLGVSIDDSILSQSDNGGQALDIIEILIKSGAINLIAVDSVATPMPQAELDGGVGDANVGLQAHMMSRAMRKLGDIMSRSEYMTIFTNQLREKISIMFENPETTPGGRALKFYSSVRLDIRHSRAIKDGMGIIGNKVNVKVIKDKVASLFKITWIETMYGEGISYVAELLDLCVDHDIVMKSGAQFSYNGEEIRQGEEAAKAFIRSSPVLTEELGVGLREKIAPKKAEISEEKKEETQASSSSANMETPT